MKIDCRVAPMTTPDAGAEMDITEATRILARGRRRRTDGMIGRKRCVLYGVADGVAWPPSQLWHRSQPITSSHSSSLKLLVRFLQMRRHRAARDRFHVSQARSPVVSNAFRFPSNLIPRPLSFRGEM